MCKFNDIQVSINFNLQEFNCPCCKRVIIHKDLLTNLIKLRKLVKEPIYINSGYRCKAYNDQVGGTSKSYHTFGMAVDIIIKIGTLSDLVLYAKQAGFKGIGIYKTFIHLDVRPKEYTWEGQTSNMHYKSQAITFFLWFYQAI